MPGLYIKPDQQEATYLNHNILAFWGKKTLTGLRFDILQPGVFFFEGEETFPFEDYVYTFGETTLPIVINTIYYTRNYMINSY